MLSATDLISVWSAQIDELTEIWKNCTKNSFWNITGVTIRI